MPGLVRLARPVTIHRFTRVESTQDRAHALGQGGAAHGTVVVATEQLAGRGTRGRSWQAPAGGLWLSVVVRPAAAVDCLSIRVGLALANGLDPVVAPRRVELKWPNDLFVGDRKVGGILVEARWLGDRLEWVVVGVGLNVHNQVPAESVPPAGTLDPAERFPLAEIEAVTIDAILTAAEATAPRLSDTELAMFADRDWLAGRAIDRPERGRCAGIDDRGRLLVERDDGSTFPLTSPLDWAGLAAGGVPS